MGAATSTQGNYPFAPASELLLPEMKLRFIARSLRDEVKQNRKSVTLFKTFAKWIARR